MKRKNKSLIIAIDGTSSSGKGTLSQKLAKYYNIPHLNTGGLYRAVAHLAIAENFDIGALDGSASSVNSGKITGIDALTALASRVSEVDLDSRELYNEEVGEIASIIAANKEVRRVLFDYQQNFAKNPQGAVLDGRDIGTVVCPYADFKFYITAGAKVRAQRRYKQLKDQGANVDHDTILAQIRARDEKDKTRTTSPLKKAEDAIEVNTDNMTASKVFDYVVNIIDKAD